MLNRIIRIAAAACTLLMVAGCARTLDPAQEGNAIRFTAGSALLRDDAKTKGGDIKDGTAFDIDDAFTVYGRRHGSLGESIVFNGETVTKESTGWEYSPARFWFWESEGNYYDFVAVYPAGKGSVRMAIPDNLAVQTAYNIERTPTPDNYDLMAATYRRRGNVADPCARVDLSFSHMTSAVGVVIINNSTETNVTISQIEFQNLAVCGDAKVTLDNLGNTTLSWINTERNTNLVRTTTYSPNVSIAAGSRYALDNDHPDGAKDYDLMIPQSLDQAAAAGSGDAHKPKLLLTYKPGSGASKTATITLKDVPKADTTPLTSWEIGHKYTYFISMRLDGGLLVSISTTAWDDVEAETPGLLIP